MRHKHISTFVCAALVCMAMGPRAALAELTYTVVVDYNLGAQSSGGLSSSTDAPSINEAGQIVYTQFGSRTSQTIATLYDSIHLRDGASDYTLASTTGFVGPAGYSGQRLVGKAINNDGQVFYNYFYYPGTPGLTYSGSRVYSSNDHTTSTIQLQVTSPLKAYFSDRSFNDSADIVYRDDRAVTLRSGTNTTTIGTSTSLTSSRPMITNDGDIAWIGASGSPLLIDPAGPTSAAEIMRPVGSPFSINDEGGFVHIRAGDVYVGDTTGTSYGLIGTDIPGESVITNVSINDDGAVVAQGEFVYFARAGATELTPILKVNDPFGGSTLEFLQISGDSLNNANQLAFRYELANGTFGVAVIQIVPECGNLLLLSIAALVLGAGASSRLCGGCAYRFWTSIGASKAGVALSSP